MKTHNSRRLLVGKAAGKITLLFFLTAILSLHPSAADKTAVKQVERDIVAKIRDALSRIKPFKVDFVQQVLDEDADTLELFNPESKKEPPEADIEEKGEIIFNHHRQLKWTYLEPDFKVFLLEGDSYRFYDEDNEQVLTGTVKERNQQWIWQLLFSEDLFRSRQLRWNPNTRVLIIDGAEMKLTVAVDETFKPVMVLQDEPTAGSRILYRFNSYRPKISIDGKTFRLDIPKGVDIIREEER